MSRLYGRRPALFPALLQDLRFYVAGALPTPPPSVAVPVVANPGDLTLWGMGGNDRYGDCGVIGLVHGQMAVASILGLNGVSFPNAQQVIDYYLRYTKGQDSGVVLSDFLKSVQSDQNGMYGELVDAYAPVAVQDIPTLQYAINEYGFAYVGVTVTQGMEDASNAGQPWTLDTWNSPQLGGHCIVLVGYDTNYLYAITWGEIQKIPYSTWHYCGDEAWAVVSGYQTQAGSDGRGVSYEALKTDLARLA